MRLLIFIFLLLLIYSSEAQPKTDAALTSILSANKDSLFQNVLQQKNYYRVQIIYTQINRDKNNIPHFKDYYFNVDSLLYFNPASTVKLPLAVLSLEKLNNIHQKNINKYTGIQYDSAYPRQTKELYDSTSQTGLPSIAQFIRKAFLISDNDAYNRMYEFVGQQTINENLHNKGYKDVRIIRQFLGYDEDGNRHTNPVNFIDSNEKVLYHQPMAYNKDSFDFSHTIKLGKAHYNSNYSLVNEPMDFTRQNNISLHDLQQVLKSVLFPQSVSVKQRFNLTKDDYDFLKQYLSQYPSETNYPKYDTSTYYDSYVKFFLQDSSHKIPNYIRVFNKVGWSYGFLIDVSYIVDFKNNIEFMLAATMYVNKDEILNDDNYEYDAVGHPFFNQLGKTIYNYELHRDRKYKPGLTDFKIRYEHRDVNDTRKAIKDADN